LKEIIIKDVKILIHEDCKEDSLLVKKLYNLTQMNLYMINRYQQEERHYPNSQADCEHYCLYLGSITEQYEDAHGKPYSEDLDLWHYPYDVYNSHYSTGIIDGNEAGNYRSGWPSLALQHECYKKLLRREVVCGLVTDPKIIIELGLAALDLRPDMSEVTYNEAINKAGGGERSNTDGDYWEYGSLDWWEEIWIMDELKRKGI
jgi:hypothetical protein